MTTTSLSLSDVCGSGSLLTGGGFITLSNASLDFGENCTFSATLNVPSDATAGIHTNTTSDIFSTGSSVAGPATASLTIVPSVTSVSVPGNKTYIEGNNLDFTVNTTEAVTVNTTGGTPSISLTIGGIQKTAIYLSGSDSTALVFRYVVESGLTDLDGITLGAAISLNSGTIKNSLPSDLDLTLSAVGSLTAVLVDSISPTTTISAIGISTDTGSSATDFVTNNASQTITATLSSPLVTGEILYGSVNAGTSYSDVTSKVSNTTITWRMKNY